MRKLENDQPFTDSHSPKERVSQRHSAVGAANAFLFQCVCWVTADEENWRYGSRRGDRRGLGSNYDKEQSEPP